MRRQAILFPSQGFITLAGWLYPWAKSKFTQLKLPDRRPAVSALFRRLLTCIHQTDMYEEELTVSETSGGGFVVFFFLSEKPTVTHTLAEFTFIFYFFRFLAIRGQEIKWNYQLNVRRRLYFLLHQDIIPLNKSDMAPPLPSLAQKINVTQRPVNSSIICSLSCLIKHISSHPRTNDSHHLSHESIGCGRTTTWPWTGWSAATVPFCFLHRAFQLLALPKNSGREGKNAITARLSYCFRLTFLTEFMNTYESILHLNLNPLPSWLSSPHQCWAGGTFNVSLKPILTGRVKYHRRKLKPGENKNSIKNIYKTITISAF